jgi:HAD superfamily hydrolase (TIGR01509 family)
MTDRTSPGDIRLICFDIGGVLVRICRTWPEACAAAGLPWREAIQAALTDTAERRRELVDHHQTGRMAIDPYCAAISEVIGGAYSAAEIRAIHDAWLLDAYEGVSGVVDALHDAGLPTACLSNTNDVHWARMNEFDAVARLRHRFASHLIGHHKPDAGIYEHFERAVGLPGAGAAIMFFDDREENVAAARERGWHAVQIDPDACTATQISRALEAHGVLCGARVNVR